MDTRQTMFPARTEARQRAFDLMRERLERGLSVVIGTEVFVPVGAPLATSCGKRIVCARRATREEFIKHRPGPDIGDPIRVPYYWELKIEEKK